MNVLALFDGNSSLRIAIERAGIKVDKYYASEIDKYAMKVSQANFPDIIQLGDISEIYYKEKTGGIYNKGFSEFVGKIDLIVGGSPCQGFSFAGKQLNFKDPRSSLFFEFVRILKEVKPKYFLLENVKMKKEYQDIISGHLGVEPIEINSSLVSAQNRRRLYWTNIPGVKQPEDKKIMLKDILDDGSNQIAASRGRYIVDGKRQDHKMKTAGLTEQRFELRKDHKSNTLTTVQKDNYVIKKIANVNPSGKGMNGYVYDTKYKSPTVTTNKGEGTKISSDGIYYRKLTPIECERLQTLPDNYTNTIALNNYFVYNDKKLKNTLCKNAKLKIVQEKQERTNMVNFALCTTSDLKKMELQSFLRLNVKEIKSANIVIEKLEKKEAVQEECVINITKTGLDTETLCILIKTNKNLDQEGIEKELMVRMYTGQLLKIRLVENCQKKRLFIILILIRLITISKIYTYVTHKANIQFSIESLNQLQENLLEVELLNFKMKNISYQISNTQRYKMLGNGWTVDVIAHILSFIKK